MAVHAIPNPTKTLTVNFPIETVREAVKNVNLTTKGFKKTEEDDVMSLYQFHILELMSLGALVDVTLEEVSETKTKIEIEVKRAIGSFNQWYEISKAKTHIENITKGISNILSRGVDVVIEEATLKQKEQEEKAQLNMKKNKRNLKIIFGIIAIMFASLTLYGLITN